MLRSTSQLFGYTLEAKDGRIGKVNDFYLDDHVWRVRYLVAQTGGWLSRKEVLISPVALDAPHPGDNAFPILLTQEQIRNSPEVDTDKPVSRQMEEAMSLYYGWPSYWSMEPFALASASDVAVPQPAEAVGVPAGDPHLRSIREMAGYHIRAEDREESIAEVRDFIVDHDDWTVKYIVARAEIDQREFVLNPWWTREIDWAQRAMHFDLTEEKILASPIYDASMPFNAEAETQLRKHYER
jgi:hypothetical protein